MYIIIIKVKLYESDRNDINLLCDEILFIWKINFDALEYFSFLNMDYILFFGYRTLTYFRYLINSAKDNYYKSLIISRGTEEFEIYKVTYNNLLDERQQYYDILSYGV